MVKPSRGLLNFPDTVYTAKEEKAAAEANGKALYGQLELLALHYSCVGAHGIDWRSLAISLPLAHVAGMQLVETTTRGRGRPKRNLGYAFEPYASIFEVMREGNHGVANACRILSKRKGTWHGKNPASLESRFHETAKKLDAMSWLTRRPLMPADEYEALEPLQQLRFRKASGGSSDKYPEPAGSKAGLFGLGEALMAGRYDKT